VKEKYPNLNENDIENVNQVRLWWEQIENNEEVYKQIRELKEDVQKYRLWKEQECVCMYTGRMINITNLFDGTQTQIMHTFPASISFDSSLANLTVGDAYYNNHIQGNKIPSQLPNYKQDAVINGKNYTAIEPRLKKWKAKVEHLKNLIDDNKKRTKKTQDAETKKGLIQRRHFLQFDYDYWNKKVKTFTATEIPARWKNSQLVDTQIISKYARAYLKTVFEKVDVQKGTTTDIFKKIYQIKGDEQKDRSKHSHHAVDAAILTLIPGSARREAILQEYYKAEENHDKYPAKPYPDYQTSHLLDIEKKVIINHIPHDKTLTETKKKITISKKGKKIDTLAQGDSIRGQLHKETFFGAVKALERNEQGYPVKENGKYKVIQNSKTKEDEIWIVSRKPIKDIKIDKDIIVDELLKNHIQKQLENGKALTEVVDFNNKPIRHIRIRVKAGLGVLKTEKAMPIKQQTYLSKHLHKQDYLVQNETNYLFLLYEGLNDDKKVVDYKILNLFEIAKLGINTIRQIKADHAFQTMTVKIKNKDVELALKVILKVGDKAIFYKESKEEIAEDNVLQRMYKLFKFDDAGTTYLYFQHISEARPDADIKDEQFTEFDASKYQARLKLGIGKLTCLFEGKDFEINLDGTIKLL
jgi:CRISPR-associated endonuclease Csn1